MIDNDKISCSYIDHNVANVANIARVLQQYDESGFKLDNKDVILATCQRIEIYSSDIQSNQNISVFGELSAQVKYIKGLKEIIKRLAFIASGSESLLLGESFV